MGIYAKYDLTKYGFQSKTPITYYSCDKFIVTVFDGYTECIHEYNSWGEAQRYFQRVIDEQEEDSMDQISIIGLVFN